VSLVTGVRVHGIEIQLGDEKIGAEMGEFMLVLRIPYHNSEQQNWHVHRLSAHLSNPTTQIRLRLHAMLQQRIQAWSSYTTGSRLEIMRAMAHFPSGAHNRRLLAVPAARRTTDTAPNQTTSFFVRSYDAIENSDSMLSFWSVAGYFSRMLVLTVRYSLASYCFVDEIDNIQGIEQRLAPAIRSASNYTVARVKVVSFSPSDVIRCPARSVPMGPSDIRLDVEVIVYYHSVGVFSILGSSDLLLAGVEQVFVIPTKNASRHVDVVLDTQGFQVDGAVFKPLQVSRLTLAAIVGICLGALCAGLLLFGLCWYLNARTPSLSYTPLLATNASQCYALSPPHVFPLCECQHCIRDRPCFVMTVISSC